MGQGVSPVNRAARGVGAVVGLGRRGRTCGTAGASAPSFDRIVLGVGFLGAWLAGRYGILGPRLGWSRCRLRVGALGVLVSFCVLHGPILAFHLLSTRLFFLVLLPAGSSIRIRSRVDAREQELSGPRACDLNAPH